MHNLGSVSETDLIPHFHLDVLITAGHGWCVSNEEFDIVNENLHIYAKMIGDYRHMTSAALRKAYIVMQAKEFEDHMPSAIWSKPQRHVPGTMYGSCSLTDADMHTSAYGAYQ